MTATLDTDVTQAQAPPEHDLARLRDFQHRYEILPIEACFVDEYQRPLSNLYREISELYLPPLGGVITVSERHRKLPNMAIIDGQTRWTGAREYGETQIPAVVYSGLTRKDESLIFALIQIKRRNLTSYQTYRAFLLAGESWALDIQRITQGAGFTLSAEEPTKSIRAVGALQAVYKREEGPALLSDTLAVLARAWGTEEQQEVTSSDMIRGVAYFIEDENLTEDDQLDFLVEALRMTTPEALKADAALHARGAGRGTGSKGKAIAKAIKPQYVKARRRMR